MAQALYASRIAPGSHRAKTPEGYLVCKDVPIARTGYQTYKSTELKLEGPERLVSVYRDAVDVFDPAAMASFEGKSITTPHPPQFLTPDNDMGYAKGHVQNVRRGGLLDGEETLIADLMVKDGTLISQIENKILEELSCGYEYKLAVRTDDGSGEEKYSQVFIRGNHVAVVPNGRAGTAVRILDAMPEEEEVDVRDGKYSLNEIFIALGLRKAVDAESEAVTRNAEKNAAALELKERTMDGGKEEETEEMKGKDKDELEKEDKGAKEPDKKKEVEDADAEEMKEKKAEDARKATDARLDRVVDTLERVAKALDKKTAKDEDEPEKKDKKEEAEDGDLIPVETLSGKEIPENPIPGADAATLSTLRALAPVVAKSGDRKAIDALNAEYRRVKRIVDTQANDGYLAVANRKDNKPEEVRNSEQIMRTADEKTTSSADAFEKAAKPFLGRTIKVNASEGVN